MIFRLFYADFFEKMLRPVKLGSAQNLPEQHCVPGSGAGGGGMTFYTGHFSLKIFHTPFFL